MTAEAKQDEKPEIEMTEEHVIHTIVVGTDWQDVLGQLVTEEGLDPQNIDLIKLTESFMKYLTDLKKFDFRIPARFVLVAAILLRMKAELLLDEEEKKREAEEKPVVPLNIDVPLLSPPAMRKPTRKVTLPELITALNKAFEFKERKETRKIRMHHDVERLIGKEEDIEERIKRVHKQIVKAHRIKFSDLVPAWKRKEIIDTFIPLLYLFQRGFIDCRQDEMFGEIYIDIREKETGTEAVDGKKKHEDGAESV